MTQERAPIHSVAPTPTTSSTTPTRITPAIAVTPSGVRVVMPVVRPVVAARTVPAPAPLNRTATPTVPLVAATPVKPVNRVSAPVRAAATVAPRVTVRVAPVAGDSFVQPERHEGQGRVSPVAVTVHPVQRPAQVQALRPVNSSATVASAAATARVPAPVESIPVKLATEVPASVPASPVPTPVPAAAPAPAPVQSTNKPIQAIRRAPVLIINPERGNPPAHNLYEDIRRSGGLSTPPDTQREPSEPVAVVRQPEPVAPVVFQNRLRPADAPIKREELKAKAETNPDFDSVSEFRNNVGVKESLAANSEPESPAFVESAPVVQPPVPASSPSTPAKPIGVSAPVRPVAFKPVTLPASYYAEQEDDGDDDGDDDDDSDSSESAPAAVAAPLDPQQETIEGQVVTLKIFANDFVTGTLQLVGAREQIRFKGVTTALKEGMSFSLKGKMVNDHKHGDSFVFSSSSPSIAPNDSAIQRFIVNTFDGMGHVLAYNYVKKIRDEDGPEAVEAFRLRLLNKPWEVAEDFRKMKPKVALAKGKGTADDEKNESIKFNNLMVARNLLTQLVGINDRTLSLLAERLVSDYVSAAYEERAKLNPAKDFSEKLTPLEISVAELVPATWAELSRNPYQFIRKVKGYNFAVAEKIAAAVDVPLDSPHRLAALIEHAVSESCQRHGHSYLGVGDLIEAVRKIDPNFASRDQVQLSLRYAADAKLIAIDPKLKRIYTKTLHNAEIGLSKNLAKLMQPSTPLTLRTVHDVEQRLARNPEKISPAFAKGFDSDQVKAVAGIMCSPQRLHVLSGGPGTGKTAIMITLLKLLKSKRFLFCANTGAAAKVLTRRIGGEGHEAKTICSLLKGSDETGFSVNEEEPLDCDVLVVDEATLAGLSSFDALLSALPADAHLIVLGDPGVSAKDDDPESRRAGQLPSIAPGRVMMDILQLPRVNHHHLTKVYRSSGGILDVVQQVSSGTIDCIDRDSVKFSHGLPLASIGVPAVAGEYVSYAQKDGIKNTFLIMPKRKGNVNVPDWNTTYMNKFLRDQMNPEKDTQKLPGTTYYLGDRILIRDNLTLPNVDVNNLGPISQVKGAKLPSSNGSKNGVSGPDFDWEFIEGKKSSNDEPPSAANSEDKKVVKVVNGDTGTLIAYAMPSGNSRLGSPSYICLALDDDRTIWYPGDEISGLDWGYAGTVHSAQGREVENVIMVVTPGHSSFMYQNMLLTGISRGQGQVIVHGDDSVLKKIAATPAPERNSGVVARVILELQGIELKNAQKEDAPADPVENENEREESPATT